MLVTMPCGAAVSYFVQAVLWSSRSHMHRGI